ncbi:hypothetical protein BC939DRAFT_462252 [Gamsiella multidivaricata]|uniref:uncharacterized protein n=1 Tax=Gamsiella multidivaricata TaxID=101098 RepID=UPI002220DC78|nr:uncharacterized protein BC939DRAFT_462252 [Gamsiella multidivaricata]KAG0359772.1 hypothetical protein BGZ54_009840 [Gamsiella multidivaricata]KAI7818730.1 hypothetical protein BC939DRAFT_462252 [Gamsiella multidivaricata]
MSRPSVRETIAAARARLAQEQAKTKTIRGGGDDERQAFVSSGVPGVRKTAPPPRRQTDVEILGHTQKSIKSLIANAKGSGIMNISSRELTAVPLEIWNMYHVDPDKVVVDFNSSSSAWYDAADLTRFIAADNKITFIDSRIQEFGTLVAVDLRSNELTTLPEEFGELKRLVNLNLSSNKFAEIPPVVFTLVALLDLQLANNQLSGPLNPAIGSLSKLESLELSGNNLTALPQELSQLKAMRKLNLSKNKIEELPVSILAQMPKLTELEISDNKLECLFSGLAQWSLEGEEAFVLPSLVRLDARTTGIQRITDLESGTDGLSKPKIQLPAVKELMLSHNNLSSLENILFATPQLYYLDLRHNRFSTIPTGVLELSNLRNLDMASNGMEHMPSELGNMFDLTTFVWEGNPIRNLPRTVTSTEALMKLLRRRQETDVPSPVDISRVEALSISAGAESSIPSSSAAPMFPTHNGPVAGRSASFSARTTPEADASSKKPSSAVNNLNLAKKGLKEVSKEEILEACLNPQSAILDSNALVAFPVALHEAVGATLIQISIQRNKIPEFPFTLSFPFLASINLSENAITTLDTISAEAAEDVGLNNYPNLNELNLTGNRLTELPVWLPKAFPRLKTLNASRNKITAIEPKSLEGLIVVDLSGNEIGSLPPLLGNIRSIKSIMLDGNLFRVPRRQIMDQGTEAVMEYLRGRIPV